MLKEIVALNNSLKSMDLHSFNEIMEKIKIDESRLKKLSKKDLLELRENLERLKLYLQTTREITLTILKALLGEVSEGRHSSCLINTRA